MPLKIWERDEYELTMRLHALKELDDDLGGRTDQHLSPSTLLSVGNGFKTIGEY
jgi:hypothetical protein